MRSIKLKKSVKCAAPGVKPVAPAPAPAQPAKRKVPSTPAPPSSASKKAKTASAKGKKKKKSSKKQAKQGGRAQPPLVAIGAYIGPRSKKAFSWTRPTDGTTAGLANPGDSRVELADLVARVGAAHCEKQLADLGHQQSARAVKAAICLVAPDSGGGYRVWVVASGQGNKIVDRADADAATGEALKDLHAEALCRRGLVQFLWRCVDGHHEATAAAVDAQFAMLAGDRGQAAATPASGSDADPTAKAAIEVPMLFKPTVAAAEGVAVPSLQLLPGLEFHIYMSATPCGAAREMSATMATEEGMRRNAHAVAGCTIVPGTTGVQPTKGVFTSKAKLCCTDKMAMWSALGLQGTLLTMYIDPVYLTGVVVGGPGKPEEDFERSVVGRMAGLGEKLEPTQYTMPPLSVHRAPDGFGDTTEGIKGFRGTWSKTCFVWSVLSGVQEVRMATGRHHLPKHPFTATPPAVSRAKFLDALVAVATRTKDSRVLPPAAAGDAGKKKKKNKFAKLKEKKKAATSTTWPPKRDPSSLRGGKCPADLKAAAAEHRKAKSIVATHIGCWSSNAHAGGAAPPTSKTGTKGPGPAWNAKASLAQYPGVVEGNQSTGKLIKFD